MAKALLGLALWLCLATSALHAAPVNTSNPSWGQLTAEQQQALAPIEGEWDKLDAVRKRKWIGIAQRYPSLKPDEQERLQRRMKDWAALTPEQRRAAREKFKEFEQLPADERQVVREKWERYKQQAGDKAPKSAPPAQDAAAAPADTPPAATGLKP